jgi:PAS domain-containing protein
VRAARACCGVEELLGYAATDWRGMSAPFRVHPDDLPLHALDPEVMNNAEEREVRLLCADGSSLRVREVVRCVDVADCQYLRGVILDIAEEAAAREEMDRLAAVVAHQTEPLLVIAARESIEDEPRVLQVNPAFAALAGMTTSEAAGRLLVGVAPWLRSPVRVDLDGLLARGVVTATATNSLCRWASD